MSGIGPHKLSDALPRARASRTRAAKGRPAGTPGQVGEQAREAHEREAARNAEASIRGHMVDIGRGNQQAGRQNAGQGD